MTGLSNGETSGKTSRSWFALGAILLVPSLMLFSLFKFGFGFWWPYAGFSAASLTALGYVTFLKGLFTA
jgi:hypothetical protein